MTAPFDPLRPDPAPSRWFVAGWALLAGAVMFGLGIYHNNFPSEFHPDEPAKVAQLLHGTRDYHHPPLMLTLADATAQLAGVPPQPQSLARLGRLLSAAYLAGAVALLTVLAGIYGGTRGAVVVAAAALATDAQAVLAAHFFKEDALFMLALALTFVAGAVHWRRRGRLDRLALGAAAGLALSSKYVGSLAVIYALALAALAALETRRSRASPGGSSPARGNNADRETEKLARFSPRPPDFPGARSSFVALGWCALGIIVAVTLCNGPALWGHFDEVRAGWRLGVSTVQEGNGGVGARVPHLEFVGMLFAQTPLPVLWGAAIFWLDLRHRPFLANADRWLAGLAPIWLTAVFSFSASTAVRYFLPVSLLLSCVAGTALPGAVRWIVARAGPRAAFLARPGRAAAAAAGLVLFFTLPGTLPLVAGFAANDRAALALWIAAHLPPDAVIAEDALAQLPTAGLGSRRLVGAPVVADLGDVAALRARGVRYVVVCWYDSRRYVDPRKRPGADAHDFLRRRAFYESLPVQARSLWKSDLRQPFPLRPGLELFALDP